ncbi:MAG: ATP-dependent RecD-like DNA helicase [Planctomycetota bacterium]
MTVDPTNPNLDILARELAQWLPDHPNLSAELQSLSRGSSARLPSMQLLEGRIVDALVARLGYPQTSRIRGSIVESDGLDQFQMAAVHAAFSRSLTVITGGPGTGKSRTIAGLAKAALRGGLDPRRMALTAPTGKSVSRMVELLSSLGLAIPPDTVTLHRLLGYSSLTGHVRHHPGLPLPHDLVVVDEASMADLWLFEALLGAVSPTASLVILGDADQLPSVRAGAVFRDLVASGVLGQGLHRLQKVYRTQAGVADLGSAAKAVIAGDVTGLRSTMKIWNSGPCPQEPGVYLCQKSPIMKAVETWALAQWETLPREGADRQSIWDAMAHFRLLAARRTGPLGVERFNEHLHSLWARKRGRGVLGPMMEGEPLIALSNEPRWGLANGEPALVIHDEAHQRDLAALFKREGGWEALPLSSLRGHVALAHAVSVHRSQGSEYDRVLLVLPEATSPLAAREILYTGLTRARTQAVVMADPGVLEAACSRRLERESGLADALRRRVV